MTSPSSPDPAAAPVWAKRIGDAAISHLNVAYCAGRDVRPRPPADEALVPHDLATNMAHAIMLGEAGILTKDEAKALQDALRQVRARAEAGETILDPACEDVHMSIERLVTDIAGPEAGGKLHTGRSRNDQVATDLRLWLREAAVGLAREIGDLTRALARHALAHTRTVCPGFTHMQPAMVTTWGHWVASYLPRLLRDLRAIEALLVELEECPLGSAASFGTSWPIDRQRTAALLGFRRPTPSTIDPIWSRGETEARFAFLSAQHLAHLAGIAQDLILLSSPPRDWVRLPDECVTGSSIMPQKRNPDFCEVTRAKAAVAAGQVQALLGMASPLMAGYNRDSQWTKYIVMDVGFEVEGAPLLFARAFETLAVNAEAMRAACGEGFLNATDVADFLARSRKLPFRACYRVLGAAVQASESEGQLTLDAVNDALAKSAPEAPAVTFDEWVTLSDPQELLTLRRQPGGPHPEAVARDVESLADEAKSIERRITTRADRWHEALRGLMG